ncbi:tRNA 2-selenouridine(34) synthase MnmH [Pseudanabaena sp. FACHB-2040]|uniref:tRNA 2-selenouridine(34) synthase MnmH n=1 Tax=Pseudanabaena sp. FACHB-2040 TaxID=2692859 RepID=UPI0016885C99|nr:tRNA 2-selenouridine(34) synthase MnmH [Pseudanabaena sp. FACHB-2040]MBD2258543.1 tRNA 2-selenouridine(34) synthase MnmH [Pseudanabaena sp. FACHB-2040]
MVRLVQIEAFLNDTGPVLDVRSPGEFEQGHLPGAVSFPLFSDEERAEVGTCYKHQGRDAAVELGFAIAGPKSAEFIRQAKKLAPDKRVRVHCWRGGMRSGGIAWALELAGFQVTTLEGGYKSFRRWVRQTLVLPRPIIMLGGMTGTDKTSILHALVGQGAQALDLEALANHRGSSYGGLDMPPQPSTEQFENLIAVEWAAFNPAEPVWVEAESRRIGTCRLPDELFQQMEAAPTLEVTRPLSERLDLLVQLYGQVNPEDLVVATERIGKRLGGQRTQVAIALIRQRNFRGALEIILDYYDRTYRYDLDRRQKKIPQIDITGLSAKASAQCLCQAAAQLFDDLQLSNQQPQASSPLLSPLAVE